MKKSPKLPRRRLNLPSLPAVAQRQHNDFLEYPYEYSFKGDPAPVEAVFQAVGFATQHGLLVPGDGMVIV
jgi:hypothetical protein